MNQPTDPRGSNGTERNTSAPNSPRGSRSQQDTVLISDVPDAEALAAASREPSSQAPAAINPASLHLSSAALAALGQRYDVLDAAGHGSMGNVYKARDRETGEIVALKLLKPEIASDQQMMDRFKNELLFARKITHKNICRVHEFNRLGGIAYTSMEFVEGESLRSVLNRFGALSLRKGVDLARQMCSGLKEAHAQGIVHRDLKPENVMIDSRGNVKIMDFGIARSMETLTRMTGAMVGTPAYMAPEQVAGKPVDYRTDIYSLGLILYEVFTGTQAFAAENAVAVAMKQLRESPAPPHEIDPSIPVPIERAILKALEKEPEKRFQSIAEMEKVFASPAVSGAALVGSSTTAGRSTQEALALQPTIATQVRPHAAHEPVQLKPSRGKGLAVLASFVFFALIAAGAARWAQKAKQADLLPPPPAPAAPALPDFAFAQRASGANAGSATGAANTTASSQAAGASVTTPTQAQNPAAMTSATSAPAVSQNAGPATGQNGSPATSQSALPATISSASPATIRGASPALTQAAQATQRPPVQSVVSRPNSGGTQAAPSDVQQRADAAFKENGATTPQNTANAAPPAQQPMGSVVPGKGPSYIWVARFEREDRAQDASRKIQGLGLTSVVMPRRQQDGQIAFVVFTGPFPPARIPSVIEWLRTQGFNNVREVKPNFGQARGRKPDVAPQNNFEGNPE